MAVLHTKRMTAGLFLVGASQNSQEGDTPAFSQRKREPDFIDFVSYTAVCPEHVKRHWSSRVTPTPLVHPLFLPLGETAVFALSQPFGGNNLSRGMSGEVRHCWSRQLSDSHCLNWKWEFQDRIEFKEISPSDCIIFILCGS